MAGVETLSGGNIEPRGLEEEMRSSYLDYAMSVIAVSYTHLTLPTTPYV